MSAVMFGTAGTSERERWKRKVIAIRSALFAAVLAVSWAPSASTEEARTPQGAAMVTRFAGKLSATDAKGRTVPLAVEMRVWSIGGQGSRAIIPASGFYIANVISGDIVTVINGQREARAPGEYWLVPAGLSVIVETHGQTATLQTVAVARGALPGVR
jgi:hypothetical protein